MGIHWHHGADAFDGRIQGNKSSYCKPCEEFENGVKNI